MAYGNKIHRLSPLDDGLICSLTEKYGGKNILDIACGRGDRLRALSGGGNTLCGIDIDGENVSAAQENASGADIRCADACAVPFPTGMFDTVLCECSLSLFDEPEKALGEMYRVLRPNGTLILSDICFISDEPKSEAASDGELVRRIFSSAMTEKLICGAGFNIVSFEDRRNELYAMAAQMIFDGTFCECVGSATAELFKRTKAGYGLWVCRKALKKERFGAVVAAAGLSSRMGEFKPLLEIGGVSLIKRCVSVLKSAGIGNIIIVTGKNSQKIEKELCDTGAMFVYNNMYESSSMFDSVCLGLKALNGKADRIFITPADIPLVSACTVSALKASSGDFVRPTYKGRGGHPIVIASGLVSRICGYVGDFGLRGAVDSLGILPADIETGDEGITLDADTPEDYKRLTLYYERLQTER